MSDSFRASPCPRPRGMTTAWVAVILVALAPWASAQFDCLEFLPPPMFDTSNNPAASPSNPRSRGAEVIQWGGHQYLVHGTGNELEFFNVDNPASPGPGFRSGFGVPPYGDRDYNLFNFSVCDDCRFGAAGFDVQGLVLFDFGSGAAPGWADKLRWVDSGSIGAFTFKYNNQQYLIARVSSQCQGNALVTFNGVRSSNLGFVQCVAAAGGVPITVDAGFWLDDTVPGDEVVGYVYLLDSGSRDVHMFSVRVQGGHPHLTAEGAVIKAVWILDHGFDIVEDPPAPWAPFAVSAYNDGLKVWDLSDPMAPYPIYTTTLPFMVAANSVEAEYPYLYVGTMHTPDNGSGHTYDISNPFQPQEFEPEFWYRGLGWNDYNYMSNKGGAFTPGGDWLFLTRYSVMERFAVDCVQSAPAASYSVSPNNPFPGDAATITTTTPASQYTESAQWISDAAGTIVAGSAVMSSATPTTLQYTVPSTMLNAPYTAHVAVARPPEFPCPDPLNNPGQCAAGQIASGVLDVDGQPQAVLAITPVAVITGDTLTLDGRATEGHPSSCAWEVWLDGSEPPVEPPVCDPANILATYPIPAGSPGEWTFRLTANYDHPAPIAGLWFHTATQVVQISSVAAAFSVYPAQPVSTQDVVLCSDSRAATANLGYFWWLAEDVGFTLPVTDASTCVSGITECGSRCGWRVDEAYFPDENRTYYGRLRVTNLDNQEESTFTDDFYVTNGALNPSFSWVPTNPSVGGTVRFHVSGVGSVDSTRWDFGRTGCSPYTQVATCTPSAFESCLDQSFQYAQSGTNIQVQLWVTVAGIQHGPYSEYIDVGSGTCGGGTTCTYSISPTSAAYGSGGGSGTISVDASASNCAWSASTSSTWIHITAGSSGTGDGTVAYSVDSYTGSNRTGYISVASRTFTVTQTGSGTASVDFSISDLTPDIGEQVTFTVNSECQTPQRWVMGGLSCDDETEINCAAFPSLCRQVTWRYKTSGTKTVNLYCAEGNAPPHSLTVQNTGTCGSSCDKDGPPDASFNMAPNPVLLGETVTFTDTSSQSPKILADFSWVPVQPDIAQAVTFRISGVSSVTSVAWDFGAAGCSPYTQTTTCTPQPPFVDCLQQTYKFASAGTHTVSARINGGGPITHQVTVVDQGGSCGGTTCTYSLNPTSASVGASAGSGTVTVTTDATCTWTAQANSSWLHVTSGASYVGSGTVNYTWDANTGSQRNGGMTIANRSFSVTQAAGGGGTGGGYLPTSWQWTVRLGNQTVATSSQPSFTFTPNATGEYTVTLVASNCAGSDTASQTLVVYEEVRPEEFMVPAVVHAPGFNNTVWRSDLRIFNPGAEQITASVEYRPRDAPLVTYGVQAPIAANGTWVFDDITSAFNLPGDTHQGSLRITFEGGDGTTPVVVSRTYNDVAVGTYGQYVPALPVMPPDEGNIYLPGLVHNADYRTNLLLANLGPDPVGGIVVNILDAYGTVVGTHGAGIPGSSSNLLVGIVDLAGVTEPLDLFTVEVDAGGAPVTASASLIDQVTGDPLLYGPGVLEDGEVCLPGVAHLPGALGSQWRSDLTLFNPTLQRISARFDYVPEVALPLSYYFVVELPPHQSYMIQDVLGFLVGDDANTKGYLRVRATEGPTTPMVVARTYNQADAGTFGQNLESYGADDVLAVGETRYIPGVATGDPAGDGIGYRTNLGLTNASHTSAARVLVTIYGDLQGEVVGQIPYTLQAGQFVQFDPFAAVGQGDLSTYGSIQVRVEEGGPVAAYASVVDNGTQDPILIPTLRAY